MIMLMTKQRLSSIDPWLEPHAAALQHRVDHTAHLRKKLLDGKTLAEFALGHLYFGLHQTDDGWVFREWAPNATSAYLVGEFSDWKDDERFGLTQLEHGVWEIQLPSETLAHKMLYKLHLHWNGGDGYRIPAYATRVVQDDTTKDFNAQVWRADYKWQDEAYKRTVETPLIYEAHVGMSGEEAKVSSYAEFTRDVLPRIISDGYNTIQLMAVQEHPYYGSFGYHVSSFFAASSRFGTPEELKALVDAAHQAGIAVILDLVHSHAVKNEIEGLSRFDGTLSQYFHEGPRGDHEQWDSRVFDYAKPEVLHFLLSNCRYWLDEYHFDGYRFDGVTSMLYSHHGMGKAFTTYDDYFSETDDDAISYLSLANELIHTVKPHALTIAEEMSGMPGLAGAFSDGGVGFDYRLSMGVPDLWIKYIKETKDEDWKVSHLFHELTQHRPEEQTISYAESHDQALVGDKTLIFRLADKAMYDHMLIGDDNLVVDRAIALHKMIRLLTASTNSGGYLNFMGNEFGHPEWIDFPREGNDWSYAYARRQWSLADDPKLKYHWLGDFDKVIVMLTKVLRGPATHIVTNDDDHVIAFARGNFLFVFNFHPETSFTDYGLTVPDGNYTIILSSDGKTFGGFGRIDTGMSYPSTDGTIKLYLPARTAVVLSRHGDTIVS
jgi:1,4-alpha-glucan branching enzyme